MRAVTSAHSEQDGDAFGLCFMVLGAYMWWIKQNHVNLPFLSSKSRMGVNLWHFNGLKSYKVIVESC